MKPKTLIEKLSNYKILKAEIKDIELNIEELREDISVPAISYEERPSPTNKFNSAVENDAIRLAEKTTELEKEKRHKEREIERIDNALSVLDEKEKKILKLKHIENYKWDTVTYTMDRSYSNCKLIEANALSKISRFL